MSDDQETGQERRERIAADDADRHHDQAVDREADARDARTLCAIAGCTAPVLWTPVVVLLRHENCCPMGEVDVGMCFCQRHKDQFVRDELLKQAGPQINATLQAHGLTKVKNMRVEIRPYVG